MNDRTRIERADAGALLLVAAIFLTYTVSGSAWYFSDGRMPAWLLAGLAVYAPWALAAAVDVLGILVGRRVHASLHSFLQSAPESTERARAQRSLAINAALLVGLVGFTAYNGVQFLAESGWRPGGGPLALAGAWPYLLRALAGPLGFVIATILTPVQASLSARIRGEVHGVAHYALGLVRAQWRRRLKELDGQGVDLTPLLIELSEDPQERAILEVLYRGMHPSEARQLPAPALVPQLATLDRGMARTMAEAAPRLHHSVTVAPRRHTLKGRTSTLRRGPIPASVEPRARAVWVPGMGVETLQAAAGISRGSAQKYAAKFAAETASQQRTPDPAFGALLDAQWEAQLEAGAVGALLPLVPDRWEDW
jgi:hypothetical protein